MPHVDHMLVPVDLHDSADPVLAWAVLLARTLGSRITVLHANESFEGMRRHALAQTDLESWRTAYNQWAHETVAALVARHCEGLAVATVLAEGRAYEAIIDAVAKDSAKLVVMGTHGQSWYRRILLGSTAEAFLRTAPCPVLIVPNAEEVKEVKVPPRIKTLLLPTDFSLGGMVSEEWALQLAANNDIFLLHAIENPLLDTYDPDAVVIDFQQAMAEALTRPPRSAQPFWVQAHRVAHAKLAVLQQKFMGVRARTELLVQEGAPVRTILDTAEQRGVDLIVMATHGRSGVRRLLLGSVTEAVLRSTSRPVLAVRSE